MRARETHVNALHTPPATRALPPHAEMMDAFQRGDPAYEGIFLVAVRTTGIFCRLGCRARKPKPENVEFLPSAHAALLAGYRPCLKCRPLAPAGAPPEWLAAVLGAVEDDPTRRWRDGDLRALGLEPDRVRRWFQQHHGMTFLAYSRARRLGLALGRIQRGTRVTEAALDSGYESLAGFHEAFRRLLGSAPREARGATVVTVARISTPLGPMMAGATDDALCLLEFVDRRMLETQLRRLHARLGCRFLPGRSAVIDGARAELDAYFAGRLRAFTVPVATPGTDFQQAVWAVIAAIPHGETISYAELARRVGRPEAVRAAARATGDNRIGVVIPCHRVVGSDGRLTGYGGGLRRKEHLLRLEGAPAVEGTGRNARLTGART
jgi:AraC family transcriptional regulator of adaptative response/methylated-DNA-[protein]-cysteine methyltransferase